MKQLIKSASLYSAVLPPLNELEALLREDQFADMLSLQTVAVGFVPREDFGPLVEAFAGGLSFTFRMDQKLIPGSVIKAELAKVVKQVAADTGRQPGKKEKAELRLGVVDELAQRALTRTTVLTCYHHTESNFLIVPTTSKKLAEAAVHALVMACGSVKTTTIHVNGVSSGLTAKLKGWLNDDQKQFVLLTPTGEVALDNDGRRVTVKVDDVEAAAGALNEAIDAGFQVKSLGLSFPNGTEAKLTSDFKLRGIAMFCAADTGEGEEEEPAFAAQAALEVDEVVEVARILCEMFEYKAESEVTE